MHPAAGPLTLSPSDLNDYVECAHLTTLALEVARGSRERPHVADEQAELLRRKGEAHERAQLERLRAAGRAIVEIELGEPWDFDAAAARTAQAMRDGAEVITQATFVDGRWRGRADFLLKVDRPTRGGSASAYAPRASRTCRSARLTSSRAARRRWSSARWRRRARRTCRGRSSSSSRATG